MRGRRLHLADAALAGHVEAVLSRGEPLHLQDLGGDRGGQEDLGLGLLETHGVVDRRERQALRWRRTPADTHGSDLHGENTHKHICTHAEDVATPGRHH